MKTLSPCDRCGLRSARYALLQDGAAIRVCDLCYWGQVESEDQEKPQRIVLQEAETSRAVAA